MRLLHTSDWHLGRSLYGRRRHEEFAAFLDWLLATLAAQRIDALLVAGDVFDTGTPGTRAQELYYRFLARVAASGCRHVVIIAGNHDSPTFLDAPRGLLRALDVHVVGQAQDDPADEVLLLRDTSGAPELIVAAVPYLRDRDLRSVEAGESIADKARKLLDGLRTHYAAVASAATRLAASLDRPVPIVATGHLFTDGGLTVDGDGVRELYIGTLAQANANIFAPCFDYVALGHLHVPQQVAGRAHIRYSGSPLAIGFGEAMQEKSVCVVDFAPPTTPAGGRGVPQIEVEITLVPVPCFQALLSLRGDWPTLQTQLANLRASGEAVWLEVEYTGAEVLGDLRARLDREIAGSALDILRIRNTRASAQALASLTDDSALDDLDVHEVFTLCLAARAIPESQHAELRQTYREALADLAEAERHDGAL